jgi:hypothetical protein
MIKKIKSYFTLEFHYRCFIDTVSGKYVNVYMDCYGDLYMKDGRWAFFAVHKGNVYN